MRLNYSEFNNKIKGTNINDSKFIPTIDPYIYKGRPNKLEQKKVSQYSVPNNYKIDEYGKKLLGFMDSDKSSEDKDYTNIVGYNKHPKSCFYENDNKSMSTFDYNMDVLFNKSSIDSSLETELMRGMPSHTKKSYGYKNPVENYFYYVDKDIQNPDHNVQVWSRGGESTRLDNKISVTPRNYLN
jgi:hypothetical protein